MTPLDNQPLAQPSTVHGPTRARRRHKLPTPADPASNAAATPHPVPHQNRQCLAPRVPAGDAYPLPPRTLPPGLDPDDWERNLRRVLEGMPRTINPASARILADLLADDHAPADKPTRTD